MLAVALIITVEFVAAVAVPFRYNSAVTKKSLLSVIKGVYVKTFVVVVDVDWSAGLTIVTVNESVV